MAKGKPIKAKLFILYLCLIFLAYSLYGAFIFGRNHTKAIQRTKLHSDNKSHKVVTGLSYIILYVYMYIHHILVTGTCASFRIWPSGKPSNRFPSRLVRKLEKDFFLSTFCFLSSFFLSNSNPFDVHQGDNYAKASAKQSRLVGEPLALIHRSGTHFICCDSLRIGRQRHYNSLSKSHTWFCLRWWWLLQSSVVKWYQSHTWSLLFARKLLSPYSLHFTISKRWSEIAGFTGAPCQQQTILLKAIRTYFLRAYHLIIN